MSRQSESGNGPSWKEWNGHTKSTCCKFHSTGGRLRRVCGPDGHESAAMRKADSDLRAQAQAAANKFLDEMRMEIDKIWSKVYDSNLLTEMQQKSMMLALESAVQTARVSKTYTK